MYVVYKISELFYIFNHSSNFFLYVFTRKSFRRVLKQKLDCGCFNFLKKNKLNLNLERHKKKSEISLNVHSSIKLKKTSNSLVKDQTSNKTPDQKYLSESNNTTSPLDDNNNDIDYESYWETAALKSCNLTKPNEKSSIKMFKDERKNSKLAILNKN